jgi:hypothetical protein
MTADLQLQPEMVGKDPNHRSLAIDVGHPAIEPMTPTLWTAEVCKLVQLSSGSAVYPAPHDVLCLLRPASHDAERLEP